MRRPLRHLSICAGALSFVLVGIAPASAAEPGYRVFDSAAAAVLGGIIAGPVGLVAGAVIGYTLGPTLTGVTLGPRRRVARRRVPHAPRVAAAEPQYAPMQAYGQPAQPMYMAQVPPPSAAPYPMSPAAAPNATMPPQPYPPQAAPAPRTTVYAPVPMPMALAPSGNYAARAYQPQDGQTPDPLH